MQRKPAIKRTVSVPKEGQPSNVKREIIPANGRVNPIAVRKNQEERAKNKNLNNRGSILEEIQRLQKSTSTLIPVSAFNRLVKDVCVESCR
jgi:hypothetical protein